MQNKVFYKFVSLILKPFVKLIFPYEIQGAENLSMIKTGCLLCSNHLSNMDAIFLIVGLKNMSYFYFACMPINMAILNLNKLTLSQQN